MARVSRSEAEPKRSTRMILTNFAYSRPTTMMIVSMFMMLAAARIVMMLMMRTREMTTSQRRVNV